MPHCILQVQKENANDLVWWEEAPKGVEGVAMEALG